MVMDANLDGVKYDQVGKESSLVEDVYGKLMVGIVILDAGCRVIWVNRAWQEYFGLPPEAVLGQDPSQLAPELFGDIIENPDRFLAHMLAIRSKNAGVQTFETHILPGAGRQERWLEFRSQRIPSAPLAGGRIEYYIDISERKRLEMALQESEEKFQALAETVAAALFIAQGTRNRYVNPAAEAMTGYTRQELLAMNFWDVVHPDERELIRQRGLARQRGEPVVAQYEIRLLTKDGQVRWVDMAASLIQFEGQPAILGTAFDITTRKQVEEALRREYDFVEAILNTAAAIVMVIDRYGKIVRFNRAAEEITGQLFSEVQGRPFWDFFSLRRGMDRLKPAFRSGRVSAHHFPNESEADCATPAGARRLIAFSNTALVDAEGMVDYIICIGNDITDRRQIEEMLKTQSRVLESMAEGVNVCDENGVIFYTNPAFDEMFGYRRGELHGQHVSVLNSYPPEENARIVAEIMEQLKTGRAWFGQFSNVRKDGTPFTTSARISAVESFGKKYWISVQEDITDRLRADEALRRSRARSQALLNAIPDMMFRISRDGIFLDYKREETYNYPIPPADFMGRRVPEVMPPEISEPAMICIERALQSGKMQVFEYQFVVGGQMRDYETRIVASGNNEVLTIVRDITRRKQSERQVIQAERLAVLGRMAATLAHEINNPLQAMQNHLDLVLDFPLEPEERAESLQVIRGEIKRLTNITGRVLGFARTEHAPRRPVSVNELVQQTLAVYEKEFKQSRLEVITAWQEVPPVMAAPDQLEQVFHNLVLNAIDATPEGGCFRIGTAASDGQVEVSFVNDGPIIPAEDMPRIFEPFFTTKLNGNGLGLANSYSIIQQHNGCIAARNRDDERGVVFTVLLPAFRPSRWGGSPSQQHLSGGLREDGEDSI